MINNTTYKYKYVDTVMETVKYVHLFSINCKCFLSLLDNLSTKTDVLS